MSVESGEEIIDKPYVLVDTVLSCTSDNIFGCAESVCLFAAAVFSTLCGFIAIRNIMKDRNNILDISDKIIIYIAFFQFLILVLQFGFYDTQLLHYTVRTLFFINSIYVCNVVYCIQDLSETMKSTLDKIIKITFGYAFCLWFFCGFLHRNTPKTPYNCVRIDWMLMSGSNLFLGCIQAYITLVVIQLIKSQVNPGYTDDSGQGFSKEDFDNKKIQLTGLLLGVFLPKFIQFLWDYLANTSVERLSECNEFYFAYNFWTFILFFILKFICFFLGPFSIFYVFYWKNRSQISSVQENQQKELLFDQRNELMQRTSF